MPTTVREAEPSYIGPAFGDAKVYDAMNVGVVTCRRETSLADVARMMVGYGMHAVVVSDLAAGERAWGIVTSMDIARVGQEIGSRTAGEVASTELVTVESTEPLERAARLMAEHHVNHLIVLQPGTDQPAGIITPREIAAALVYGRS